MSALDDALNHLNAEVVCLAQIDDALCEQSAALREADAPQLDSCARTLSALATHQLTLTRMRPRLLEAAAGRSITRLTELAEGQTAEVGALIADIRVKLATLAARVAKRKAQNRAWAQTGQSLVDSALRIATRRVRPPTYGASGRLRTNDGPSRLNGRA